MIRQLMPWPCSLIELDDWAEKKQRIYEFMEKYPYVKGRYQPLSNYDPIRFDPEKTSAAADFANEVFGESIQQFGREIGAVDIMLQWHGLRHLEQTWSRQYTTMDTKGSLLHVMWTLIQKFTLQLCFMIISPVFGMASNDRWRYQTARKDHCSSFQHMQIILQDQIYLINHGPFLRLIL